MGTAASLSLRTSILRLVRACQKDGCTMDEKGWNWIMGISCACGRERHGARWMNDESTDKSLQEARSRAPTRFRLFFRWLLKYSLLFTWKNTYHPYWSGLGCLSTSISYEVTPQPSERPQLHIPANIPSKIQDPSLDAIPNSNSPGDFTVWRTPQKLNATFLKIYSEKCIIIYTQNRKNFIRPRNPIYSLPVNTLHYQVNHNINCWSFYYCPSLYPLDRRPDRQVAGRKEVPLKRLLVTLLHHSTYL